MKHLISEEAVDGCSTLCCADPECGQPNLHQVAVMAYFRKEDSEHGYKVSVGEHGLYASEDMLGNPSPRRDGIIVTFTCEHCQHDSRLFIYQHKGNTFLEMK